jgi:tRNA threonylcarbamoyl adenosine modification protein YeaZ
VRILGLETSSRRGSVALVEDGRLVATRAHERNKAHAEQLLPMVAALMAEVGWSRDSLDRIGVGVGPGSFTGLRVGIALAQGIALGLGVTVVGVGSLRCMARGVPKSLPGSRWALLDARRQEVFCAGYASDGTEIMAARALPRATVLSELARLRPPGAWILVGEVAAELGAADSYRSSETDLPHASWTAMLAAEIEPEHAPAEPLYVREADAIKPDLPAYPLANQRES